MPIPKPYFSMKATKDKEAEIYIYEQIGKDMWSEGIGAKQFAEELKKLGEIRSLTVRINSPGGSVFEGLAIYNTLASHPAEKVVHIDGIAASIASVIAMAGTRVVMPQNAFMMIHDPFALVMGDAGDMRKMAETLDKIKSSIISAYSTKSNLMSQDIADLMTEETWLTAEDAKEWGFADEVEQPVKIAAHFDLSQFRNAPKNEAPAFKTAASPISDKSPKPQKEVKTMPILTCSTCGSNLVEDECPRCELEKARNAATIQAREAELRRVEEIRALGREFNCPQKAEREIQKGSTPAQFKDLILKDVKDNNMRPIISGVEPAHEGKPFRNFGDQLVAIRNAAMGRIDPRLIDVQNAIAGASETVGSDGGFLVQTDFTTALLDRANQTEVLAPKCFHIPISGNRIEAPIVDESTRATGSRWGGVQVYRVAEGGTATAKKPKLSNLEMKLEKIMGVFYATDELLADASALETLATRAFTEEFAFKIDDEIVNGTGSGQMLGILACPALVSQAKETGQAAATVVAENIMKMYSRMPARLIPGAEWYINQEVWVQLFQLQLTLGTGGVPLFMPPGGLSVAPYGTLMGRPIVPIEQAAALGTVGDIIFANMKEYAIIEKGGIQAAQSIHVEFLTDQSCYRWTARNNGMPVWKSAITPYKGSASQSPFIALATRS